MLRICLFETFRGDMASAASRDLLCKELGQFTAKVVTDSLSELLSGQKPSRFDNFSLAVDPLWLNSLEPGTLDGQPPRHDAYTTFPSPTPLPPLLLVLPHPAPTLPP